MFGILVEMLFFVYKEYIVNMVGFFLFFNGIVIVFLLI